eukprot:2591879-Ditylum_brightwellii.AAC.1
MSSKNKLNDGICPKVYVNRRIKRGKNIPIEYGVLMADEMKLKHGIMRSTQSLEPVDLAVEDQDQDQTVSEIKS